MTGNTRKRRKGEMNCQKRESTASRSRIAIQQLTSTLHKLTEASGGARIALPRFKSRSNMRLALLIIVVVGIIVWINPARRARVQAGPSVPDALHNCLPKIAFASERDGNWEIYVMNTDGTGQTRLTNDVAVDSDPAFSPDGTKIAFSSDRDGDGEIYLINADGTGLTRLTNNTTGDVQPSFSP